MAFDFFKNLFGNNTSNNNPMSKSAPINAYLLLFSAEWCGPSKRFKKEIIDGGVTNFSYIDVDTNDELPAKYNIRSVPTYSGR